ncbi:MAG TPA: CBS domain-containing protein [Vicinamibacterales bacterium]|nr:CBS domain-containing protein [Vicinamibacterales bacterium]
MKVQELMTVNVRTCRPESNLAEAVKEMWEADCGALPVIGTDGQVVGVITDRDISVAVATKGRTADRIAVREVKGDQLVHSCFPGDDTTAVLKTMQTYKVHRLPVVNAQGHLQGIVSLNDIVTHAGAASSARIVSTLASICERRADVSAPSAA